jgi:threonine synthase
MEYNQAMQDHHDNQALDLLSEASNSFPDIEDQIFDAAAIASDLNRPIQERIAAYEDIIESEIGDTLLLRARNIEREFGIRQLYLKFEGGNPSGTQKDRIAFAHVRDAMRRGYSGIAIATCGNYGGAMAFASSLSGLSCIAFIPGSYKTRRIEEMERYNVTIFRTPGDYEDAVHQCRAYAEENDLYDANPGDTNSVLQMEAYGQIAYELYDELRDAPAAVAVPVSNGSTLAGVHRGFVSLYRRGKTSRMPRLIAGSASGKNPIIQAHKKGLQVCSDLEPESIHESAVNEPLINWHSIDGDQALTALYTSKGWALDASDREMIQFARIIREKEGINVLPASTAGLIAMLKKHREEPLPGDRYVAILTGRKQ